MRMKSSRILLSFIFIFILSGCSKSSTYLPVSFDENRFILDKSELKERSPVFYKVRENDANVRFFVVKLEGKIQAYFDICATCKVRNAGYRVEGNKIFCRKCRVAFDIESLKNGIGGCYPYKLNGVDTDGKYIIKKEAILDGIDYFKS